MNKRYQTIIIGGGQAGLSVGYHLKQRGLEDFVILDANRRIGDSWRQRWDSLRLFTPAQFDGLDGMPFPAPAGYFPTKDEMAAYLEAYAERFQLPVQSGARVDRLTREGDRFLVTAAGQVYEANNVVVAMATYQKPRRPPFAGQLRPDIIQIHSAEYRSPGQLQPGPVLVAGAGNSGSEIAMELSRRHPVIMAGRDTGQIPFRIESHGGRSMMTTLTLRVLFHRVLTIRTPLGRMMRRKSHAKGGPLIRVKRQDLAAAGVERAPRVVGVEDGLPVLEDGRRLQVRNVIWCTGYRPGFDWIDLPIMGEREPRHVRGVVPGQPGLYFVGLHFLYAMSSAMIHGVGRDAGYIAGQVAAREKSAARAAALQDRRAAVH